MQCSQILLLLHQGIHSRGLRYSSTQCLRPRRRFRYSVTGTKPSSVHLVSLLLLNRVRILSSALLMLQALKQDPAFHRGCQGGEPGEGQFGITDHAPQQAERISGSGHSNKASSQQACQSPVLQAAARCRAVDDHEVDDWRTNQRISSPGDASGWTFSHTSGACLY